MLVNDYQNTYSTSMARKRLRIFTVIVLIAIVILTMIARRIDIEGPSGRLSKRRYYHYPYNEYEKPSDDSLAEAVPVRDNGQKLLGVSRRERQNPSSNNNINESLYHGLTRYGADIELDYQNSCPKGSLMFTHWKQSHPRTHRCPQVFIIGAKKGGTTSLYQYLSKHPDFQGIRLNESKWIGETFYFAQRFTSLHLSEYIRMFPRGKMTGDASVDNLLFCESPSRIFKTCGKQTKIIILLRDPVKRYVSNFMMRVRRPEYGHYSNYTSISETTSIERDILMTKLNKKGISLPHSEMDWVNYRCLFSCCTSMIYEGLYYVFVMNWLCNFPKENILFLSSEEMFAYPINVYKEVLMFLGLKPLTDEEIYRITSVVYNKGLKATHSHHTLTDNDIQTLHDFYRPFNRAILELLNWNDNVNWS